MRSLALDTRLQAEKPAKPVKPVPLSHSKKTRLGGDASMSFQARCASALRLALPMELKAHGAVMPAVDLDAMADSLARRVPSWPMCLQARFGAKHWPSQKKTGSAPKRRPIGVAFHGLLLRRCSIRALTQAKCTARRAATAKCWPMNLKRWSQRPLLSRPRPRRKRARQSI